MNTRDSVKWEVIFCHFEITVDNWHFNVAPFTKQWTHLKPHEAFGQVIYHINPHFLKLNPHSHRVILVESQFSGQLLLQVEESPFFNLEMSIFGSFQEFQGPALPILPQLYVVYLLTAPGGKLHLRLVPRYSTGATELYRSFHWCLRCDWWLVLLWRWWHGRINR